MGCYIVDNIRYPGAGYSLCRQERTPEHSEVTNLSNDYAEVRTSSHHTNEVLFRAFYKELYSAHFNVLGRSVDK